MDALTVAKLWLLLRPVKAIRRWRTKRRMKSWLAEHPDELLEPFHSDDKETSVTYSQVEGIIRHILTTVGGSLVTAGVVTDGQLTAIIGGLLAVGGIVWSVVQKRQAA